MKKATNALLIIKTAALGDVLRTTAILPGLKEKYDLPIYWATSQGARPLLKNNSLIDRIFVLENDKRDKNINNDKKSARQKLRNTSFELVINLEEDYESCELASSLKSRRIFGAYLEPESRKITYTSDSSEWFDMSLISRHGKEKADYLKTVNQKAHQQILCDGLKIRPASPSLYLSPEQYAFAEKFRLKNNIHDNELVIGINSGAGKAWEMKKWESGSIVELINKLAYELNAKVILFGGLDERERNYEILQKVQKAQNVQNAQESRGKKTENMIIDAGCDNTLEEFIGLVNLCQVLLASDSLAMHIGIALKKNVNVILGPTSPYEIELYGRGEKIVSELPCICCYKRTCDKEINCMNSIKVETVFDKIKKQVTNTS